MTIRPTDGQVAEPPELTVVVPVFDPGPVLARTLRSVLDQQGVRLECVVVDDGSRERIAALAPDEFADPRVRLHRQDNRGVSVARNVGVRLGRAPLVAFLDQDDAWRPGKLAAQVAALRAVPGAAFSATGFRWIIGETVHEAPLPAVSYHDLLSGDRHVCLSSIVVRREAYAAVGGHDPVLAQQQDRAFMLNLLRDGGPAACVPNLLVDYHVHGGNASRDYRSSAAEWRAVTGIHALDARRRGDAQSLAAARRGLAVGRALYAAQALDAGRRRWRDTGPAGTTDVAGHLWRAARWSPDVLARGAATKLHGLLGRR